MRGITLFEVLIAIGIIGILTSLTLPLGLDFYKNQQLETQGQLVLQAFRLAQAKAIFQERDSSFGLYFAGSGYTLFKGASYASRDFQYDEFFDLPGVIAVSGLPEVVFSKAEGTPNVTGDVVLSNGSSARRISINEGGRINLGL